MSKEKRSRFHAKARHPKCSELIKNCSCWNIFNKTAQGPKASHHRRENMRIKIAPPYYFPCLFQPLSLCTSSLPEQPWQLIFSDLGLWYVTADYTAVSLRRWHNLSWINSGKGYEATLQTSTSCKITIAALTIGALMFLTGKKWSCRHPPEGFKSRNECESGHEYAWVSACRFAWACVCVSAHDTVGAKTRVRSGRWQTASSERPIRATFPLNPETKLQL